MGQRAAAEPAEPEHDQLAAGEPAVRLLELARRGVGQRDQRAFGDARIAFGDLERVAAPVDQLDAEREAALVDQPPDAVERDVIGLAAHRRRPAARRTPRPSGGIAKLDASNSPSNSSGRRASWSASAGAWARILASSSASGGRASSSRKRFTPLDSRSTMSLSRLSA